MKMKQVYESNPALGDPLSIQGQLTENGHRLDKLRSELKKFQVKSKTMAIMKKHKSPFFLKDFLDELEGKAPSSPAIRTKDESATDGGGGKAGRTNRRSKRRSSMSDGAESLSRSGSDSSVSNQRNSSTGASANKKQENG